MDSVRKVLDTLKEYHVFPDPIQRDMRESGMWAYDENFAINFKHIGNYKGSLTSDIDAIVTGFAKSQFRPIFSASNVGEIRPWISYLFPQLSGISSYVHIVAVEICNAISADKLGIPHDINGVYDFSNYAGASLKGIREEITPDRIRAIVSKFPVDDEMPPEIKRIIEYVLESRTFSFDNDRHAYYRRCGKTTILKGARIEIDKCDSDGNEIVDFEDVFEAFRDVPETEFIRCPRPARIFNRSETFHLGNELANDLVAVIGPFHVVVHDNIRIDVMPDKTYNPAIMDKIVDALASHRIIDTRVFEKIMETTLYVDTNQELNMKSLYLMGILHPFIHARRFYISELTCNAVSRKNDVIYYANDSKTLMHVHVYISEIAQRDPTPRRYYTIRFEHKTNAEMAEFERNLAHILYDMQHEREVINSLMPLFDTHERNAETVTLPSSTSLIGRGSCQVTGVVRPICIPMFYGDIEKESDISKTTLNFARSLAIALQYDDSAVYVSSRKVMVPIDEAEYIDEESAIYIPYKGDYVENACIDGRHIVPHIPSQKRSAKIFHTVSIGGLPDRWEWHVTDMQRAHTDILSFFAQSYGTVCKTDRMTREYIIERIHKLMPLCKPELFDHTYSEMLDTLRTLDTTLHIRMFEKLLEKNIVVVVPKAGKSAKFNTAEIEVVPEIPRHAGQRIRDITSMKRSIIILKFYDTTIHNYRYSAVFCSEKRANSHTSGPATYLMDSDCTSELVKLLVDPGDLNYRISTRSFDYPKCDYRLYKYGKTQSVNQDGYTIAVHCLIRIGELFSLLGKESESENAATDLEEFINVTICSDHALIPGQIPIVDAHYSVPSDIAKILGIQDGGVYRHGPYFVTRVNRANESELSPKIFMYQRAATVLGSLLRYFILETCNKYDYSTELALPIVKEGFKGFMNALQRSEPEMSAGKTPEIVCPTIGTRSRFLPPLEFTPENVGRVCGNIALKYFPNRLYYTPEFRQKLTIFCVSEMHTINAAKIPRTAIRYIEGLHPTFDTMLAGNSKVEHPSRGKASIVMTRTEYEYAVGRFEARKNMMSWHPIIDLTGATNARALMNKTSFVMRNQGNVIYAFAVSADTSVTKMHEHGFEICTTKIEGFEKLKSISFAKNTIVIFSTSTNAAQGSHYLLRVLTSTK